ncbi:MAG: hypothetical protein ACYC5O_22580 [Anaerolineae bacterium]
MAETVALRPRVAGGGTVERAGGDGWRLSLPAGSARGYRLAQLDDYCGRPRAAFPWPPPLRLRLRARAENGQAAGTWGFGLWNDPFGMGLSLAGGTMRLPALPNAAWFFHAAPPNHLAFHDGHPAQGFLAATFSARPALLPLLAAAAVTPPALLSAAGGRALRRVLRRMVHDDATGLSVRPEEWHDYELLWQSGAVRFAVDGALAWQTAVSPRGPLGLVLWVDNQYAALPPGGRLRFGNLATPGPAWMELADVEVTRA